MQERVHNAANLPLESLVVDDFDFLCEIGPSGLVFASATKLQIGTSIHVRLPVTRPVLQTAGCVISCRPEQGYFKVGVQFAGKIDRFHARMVQQVCRIERYRRELHEREGRNLSLQEAALEWIGRFAQDFPGPEDFPSE